MNLVAFFAARSLIEIHKVFRIFQRHQLCPAINSKGFRFDLYAVSEICGQNRRLVGQTFASAASPSNLVLGLGFCPLGGHFLGS